MIKINLRYFIPSFILFLSIYLYITLNLPSDISIHADFARRINVGSMNYPGNFIIYLLTNLLTFFSQDIFVTQVVFCVLIALATSFRINIASNYITILSENKKSLNIWSYLIALSLIFVFAISIQTPKLNNCFYFGYFVPNVWHNSTTLFVFPFAVLLFYLSYLQLDNYETNRNYWIVLLVFLNVFIKPSYFFVYAICFPLFSIYQHKLSKRFFLLNIPLVIGLLFLLIEYYVIFISQNAGVVGQTESSVVIGFLRAYEGSLVLLPVKLLLSVFFPFLYYLLNWKKVVNKQLHFYAIASWLISVLLYFTLSEVGLRENDGNFYWQVVICTWILFLFSLSVFIKDLKNEGMKKKNILLLMVYISHLCFGLFYLFRYFILEVFY